MQPSARLRRGRTVEKNYVLEDERHSSLYCEATDGLTVALATSIADLEAQIVITSFRDQFYRCAAGVRRI